MHACVLYYQRTKHALQCGSEGKRATIGGRACCIAMKRSIFVISACVHSRSCYNYGPLDSLCMMQLLAHFVSSCGTGGVPYWMAVLVQVGCSYRVTLLATLVGKRLQEQSFAGSNFHVLVFDCEKREI